MMSLKLDKYCGYSFTVNLDLALIRVALTIGIVCRCSFQDALLAEWRMGLECTTQIHSKRKKNKVNICKEIMTVLQI